MKWIISDVHGVYNTLLTLLQKVREYDESPSFVFVGDYVDRGRYNREVVDLMIKMQNDGSAVCLRGNHDNVIDWIVNDGHYLGRMTECVSGTPTIFNVIPWWMMNGLSETLLSYGIKEHKTASVYNRQVCQSVHNAFLEAMPKAHKDFFRDLPMYWENDTHFACHAYYDPSKPLPRKINWTGQEYNDQNLWSRFGHDQLRTTTQWDRVGVFGHTPVSTYGTSAPIKWDKIRLIDTGSFIAGRYICAYSCENDDWILQSNFAEDLIKD